MHVALGLACLLLFCVAAADEPAALEEGRFSIDERQLAWFCRGSGSPTIVLEAPSGIANQGAYANVLEALARRARVCAYERAFYAGSDPLRPGEVQTVVDYADELGRFLALEQVPPPYLLMGFSYGGFVARYFTGHHPDQVVGMVLIDSPHVEWIRRMKDEFSTEDWSKVQDILDWFTEHRGHDVWNSQFLVEQAPPLPADLPIAVITRDRDHERMRQSGITEAAFRRYNDIHFELAPELLRLSNRTVAFTAENTDHMVPDNDPETVLEAVDRVLSMIRERTDESDEKG